MFSSISRRIAVSGASETPEAVLSGLLTRLVSELGGDLVGHAKAVVRLEGGVIHASTTGIETGVDVRRSGNPSSAGETFQMDFMCAFHGLSTRRLTKAWEVAAQALVATGVNVIPIPIEAVGSRSAPRALGPIAGTMLSSVLVLKPCCVFPVLWAMSGSSLAFLQLLEPLEAYRVYFAALSLLCLAAGYHRLYLSPVVRSTPSVAVSVRGARAVLWASVLLFVVAWVAPGFMAPTQTPARPGIHHHHDHH